MDQTPEPTDEQVRFVAVIPAGPGTSMVYIKDTIDSIRFYTRPHRRIIVMDDSGNGKFEELNQYAPDVFTLRTPQNLGRYWGMYASLSQGYKHALGRFPNLKSILRLDDDALVIGHDVCQQSIAYFEAHPEVGLISDHHVDCLGRQRETWYPRQHLAAETHWRRLISRDRTRCKLFRKIVKQAQAHGYTIGESCFGGALFLNPTALRKLDQAGYLPLHEIKGAYLEEDHIFSLLMYSLGIRLGDFSTGDKPMAMDLLTLPLSPQDLLDRRKKVIHSLRGWADIGQDAIRHFFRLKRDADAKQPESR